MGSRSQASLSLVRTNYIRITHENTDIWKVGSPREKKKKKKAGFVVELNRFIYIYFSFFEK